MSKIITWFTLMVVLIVVRVESPGDIHPPEVLWFAWTFGLIIVGAGFGVSLHMAIVGRIRPIRPRFNDVVHTAMLLLIWGCSLWWRTHTYETMRPLEWTWCAWVVCQGMLTGVIGWYMAKSVEEQEHIDAANKTSAN